MKYGGEEAQGVDNGDQIGGIGLYELCTTSFREVQSPFRGDGVETYVNDKFKKYLHYSLQTVWIAINRRKVLEICTAVQYVVLQRNFFNVLGYILSNNAGFVGSS